MRFDPMNVVVLMALMAGGSAGMAQQATVAAHAATNLTAAPVVAGGENAAVAATAETKAETAATAAVNADAATPTKPVAPVAEEKSKSKKAVYSGPTEVIELAATPMLDDEGKQRLDPDGKPMFNAPVRQQRDKKGHPLFDEAGKPVFQTATELGYDEKGKKLHAKKEKPPKMTPVAISRGTFTVDGMTGKAELNYDIKDLKYVYLYAPGVGTVVVSNAMFPGAVEEKGAFHDNVLTVSVSGHVLEITSDKRLLDKKPESAFVALDRSFVLPTRYPVMGFGEVRQAPYQWPGAKRNEEVAGAVVKAPPTPESMRPVFLLAPCPAGQMRRAAPPVLPGQKAPEQPCVPIETGKAPASAKASQTASVGASAGSAQ